ncbi:oligosaccharide flippase family protein [Deinococcus sp. KNUC1210]|uniref:oligosaccharide flippase family protein n=1 Tax=Deinococcus sp. KNUC1210 TaxID=2917691 RepID=UPI001EEFC23A|nr:oligosaccharide flippase family protein [Deinococcus sp. KNUC1210]ULH15295.1 oligosaccharide flippase family protein [Deinococcus sp. KNUC1210]
MFSFVLLIPHFTKIFPKEVWGHILSIQALSLWLQIIVEYGFNISATRSMARVKEDDSKLSSLVSGVVGAKFFLSICVAVIGLFAILLINNFHNYANLVVWGIAFAISQGYNPVWYFLARGRFGQYSSIDFFSRLMYLILCLVFINKEDEGYLIFAIGVVTASLGNIIGYIIINRQVKLRIPSMKDSIESLKDGFSMFFFVGVTSVYTTLNLVILGISQTASIVGAYGISDRVVRAAGSLLDPINRVIFAKLSHLYHNDFYEGIKFLKKAALIIILAGCFIFIGGEVFSSYIIRTISPTYPEALQYLRLLFIFIPVLALNNVIGIHIMIPLGLDREFNIIFLLVSVISVGAMVILTPSSGATGMGIITIGTEVAACIGMGWMTFKSGKLKEGYKMVKNNV